MTEIASAADLLITKSGMDAWLCGIKGFPRESAIGKSGRTELVDGLTVEIVEPDSEDKKIVFFVTPGGILIVEQNEVGTTDLRNAIGAEEEDYTLYGKAIRRALVERQRLLSYGSQTTINRAI
ncbi:MAG: hypothetical protein Q7T50_04355 [Candidatus Magasanikbacteria bacterium]|nr:hypothetical protein [Candidatus Magasanikbacteria bacterium]